MMNIFKWSYSQFLFSWNIISNLLNVDGYQVLDIHWNISKTIIILKENFVSLQNVNDWYFSSLLKCENNLWSVFGVCLL